MTEAEKRLTEIEQRTKAAEERAAEAKRVAAIKAEEEERDKRLKDLQDSVAEAEERAREAERRAEEAEQAVMQSVTREHEVVAPEAQQTAAAPGSTSASDPAGAVAGAHRRRLLSRLRRRPSLPRRHRPRPAAPGAGAAGRRVRCLDLAQQRQLRGASLAGPQRHPGDQAARASRADRQLPLGRGTR